MKFLDFKKNFQNLPVLPARIIINSMSVKGSAYNQIERWRKRGLLVQLRRGLYVLGKTERKIEPSRVFLAGQMYQPSYISLEYALSRYGIIPEITADVTSVTTRKTAGFKNDFGAFSYQTVKPAFFRGFVSRKDDSGLPYFIAEPEKAVADFVYLNLGKFPPGDARNILLDSYRFQNLRSLSLEKIRAYFGIFGIKKMDAIGGIVRELAKGRL